MFTNWVFRLWLRTLEQVSLFTRRSLDSPSRSAGAQISVRMFASITHWLIDSYRKNKTWTTNLIIIQLQHGTHEHATTMVVTVAEERICFVSRYCNNTSLRQWWCDDKRYSSSLPPLTSTTSPISRSIYKNISTLLLRSSYRLGICTDVLTCWASVWYDTHRPPLRFFSWPYECACVFVSSQIVSINLALIQLKHLFPPNSTLSGTTSNLIGWLI